jgi:hydrogenase maturation protease
MTQNTRPRWLVFGVGNPSRGDDALGALFIERLEAWRSSAGALPVDLALLQDFQWQIEHALDLVEIDLVVFVDASRMASSPFEFRRLAAKFDATYTTHALSPECVLAVAERLGQALPEAWLLAIAGKDFDLGAAMGAVSWSGLDSAFKRLCACVIAGRVDEHPTG